MKKNSSKSMLLNKKNKTLSTIPESKKNSRIVKANSCIKINSLNSEQASKVTMTNNNPSFSKQHLSQVSHKQVVNYSISQTQHLIDKPLQLRNSVRKHVKSSIEAPRSEMHKDAAGELRLRQKNQELIKENTMLRQKCCDLQEMSLKDKQKIKNLIIRIGEVKQTNSQFSEAKSMRPSTAKLTTLNNLQINQNSASHAILPMRLRLQTPFKGLAQATCENKECHERKKYLQSQLYRQRIMRDKLQLEKREWQKNREDLKSQYNELLEQIQGMRDNQY